MCLAQGPQRSDAGEAFRKKHGDICQFIRDVTCLFTSRDMGYLAPPIHASYIYAMAANTRTRRGTQMGELVEIVANTPKV